MIEPNDSEAGQNDSEAGRNDSEAAQNNSETGQNDSEAGQNDNEAGQNDSESGQNDSSDVAPSRPLSYRSWKKRRDIETLRPGDPGPTMERGKRTL